MSQLDSLIKAGKADETDAIGERHLARTCGNPSLPDLLTHMSKFDDGDLRDVVSAGLHLAEDEYAILVEAAERITKSKRKARFK